jgi:hypothetical protein
LQEVAGVEDQNDPLAPVLDLDRMLQEVPPHRGEAHRPVALRQALPLKNCIRLETNDSRARKNGLPRNFSDGSFPELNDWTDSLKKFSIAHRRL